MTDGAASERFKTASSHDPLAFREHRSRLKSDKTSVTTLS
jgi:hypothetical protein